MLPAFLTNFPQNEMPSANNKILFGPYLGGFDQMMADFRSICQMDGNVGNISEHREELMGQMRENPYFGAICSVLGDEKQKIGQMTICLANSVKLLFGQNGGGINDEGENEEIEEKKISTVEQKMKECNKFCVQKIDGNVDSMEVEKVKAKMRECLEEHKMVEKLIKQNVHSCVEYSLELLNFHSQLRPITQIDIHHFTEGIRLSAQFWADELRDAVCSQLLLLKSFGSAVKKKRQNFCSSTISILNKYFMEHLNQPYPDEASKMALAKQCGITMAQVSNWFGNKRIRFRKAQQLKKGQKNGAKENVVENEVNLGGGKRKERITTMMVKDEPEGE